jgi:hypothetical protein
VSTFGERVAYYLQLLARPDCETEDAWHRLIELGPGVIPYLERAFTAAVDVRTRQALTNIAWQTRSRQCLPFLQKALEDAHDHVWKEALDGLVSIGGQEAIEIVRQARGRTVGDKAEWLDEAVHQITENL